MSKKERPPEKQNDLAELYRLSEHVVFKFFVRLLDSFDEPTVWRKLTSLSKLIRISSAYSITKLIRSSKNRILRNKLRKSLEVYSSHLKIAISAMGGIGDNLQLGAVCSAIKRQFPDSKLIVIGNRHDVTEFWEQHPSVDSYIVFADDQGAHVALRYLAKSNLLDLYYQYRYALKPFFGSHSKVPAEFQKSALTSFETNIPDNFDIFPLQNNVTSTFWNKGEGLIDLMEKTSGLPIRPLDFGITEATLKKQDVLIPTEPFITIHSGSDPRMGIGGQQTKNWSVNNWAALIQQIKQLGFPIYQIGIPSEETISGAIDVFKGTLPLLATAKLLQNSKIHIDTEGGMVHLARAVGTPSLVLFGPTPSSFFGYATDLHFQAPLCGNCWWATPDWHKRCARALAQPECMSSIDPSIVAQKVFHFFGKNEGTLPNSST